MTLGTALLILSNEAWSRVLGEGSFAGLSSQQCLAAEVDRFCRLWRRRELLLRAYQVVVDAGMPRSCLVPEPSWCAHLVHG